MRALRSLFQAPLAPKGVGSESNKKYESGKQNVVEIASNGRQTDDAKQQHEHGREAAQCRDHNADDAKLEYIFIVHDLGNALITDDS